MFNVVISLKLPTGNYRILAIGAKCSGQLDLPMKGAFDALDKYVQITYKDKDYLGEAMNDLFKSCFIE
jgi:hypothetical protein